MNSLLHLSSNLETTLPELKGELERELALFDRLIPSLSSMIGPTHSASATLHEPKVQTTLETPLSQEPAFVPTHPAALKKPAFAARQTPQYAGGSIPFSRSFLSRSRIIKGQ